MRELFLVYMALGLSAAWWLTVHFQAALDAVVRLLGAALKGGN